MPSGPVDFASGQQSSNEALGGAIPRSFNVLVDATGAIRLRPGIAAWSDFAPTPSLDATTSVDGIGVWNDYPVYVTSDRRIHAQPAPGYGIDISDSTAATQLDGGARPVLCSTRKRMVIAGGGLLQKWEGPGVGLSARLGGNPPAATHVCAIATFLVVNPVGLSGTLQWSGPGDVDNERWTGVGTGFQELQSDPDPVGAIITNTGELIGFGTKTVQTLDVDPNYNSSVGSGNLFLNARTWSLGTPAPYSFAQNDEQFAFLDDLKRFQVSDGRQYTSISDPALSATLRTLAKESKISDCWGFRMAIDSWDLLGFHFPTAGRTFVYDLGRKTWSEWGGVNGAWIAKSHYHWTDDAHDLHLIGLGNGTIAQMDPTVATDMGQPVVGEIVSGFQDWGSDLTKTNTSLRLYFRRGVGTWNSARPPRVQVFWRNDIGAWQGPIERDLGTPGDVNPVVEIRTMGVYKMRQWRLRMSDAVPLTFIRAIETFETGEL